MNLIRRTATAAVAALALSMPTAVATTASAAPDAGQADHSAVVAKKKPKKNKKAKKYSIKLTKSKAYSHYGQEGVKVTATVTKGKKKLRGKVTFSLNGAAVATAKLKKGKASYQLAPTTAPGTYKVTAKYKKKKKATSVRVYNSAIAISTTALTYSKAAFDAYEYDSLAPAITGTVNFKDAVATTGWVDIYKDGNIKGGSQSPDFCCMAKVEADGSFVFQNYDFANDLTDRGIAPGTTVTYYAYYTDDAGFDDYIYSAPITVTLVP